MFRRISIRLSSNHSFAIYQKSDFNRSKSHFNSRFLEFFPLHKTTFFVATHTEDLLNFIATQPKSSDSSLSPTQAINYDQWLRSRGILNILLIPPASKKVQRVAVYRKMESSKFSQSRGNLKSTSNKINKFQPLPSHSQLPL